MKKLERKLKEYELYILIFTKEFPYLEERVVHTTDYSLSSALMFLKNDLEAYMLDDEANKMPCFPPADSIKNIFLSIKIQK